MSFVKKIKGWIGRYPVVGNILLAAVSITLFLVVVSLLLNLFTRHNTYHEVPDFRGTKMDEARRAGRRASLKLEVADSLYVPAFDGGVVLEQSPDPGSRVKSGRRIFLTVNSYRQRMVDIPYVTGFSLRQAKNNLETAGLEIDRLIFENDLANNYILEERFQGRAITAATKLQAEAGSGITLIVGRSSDAPVQSVPKVVGLTLREAKSRLWEVGYNIGNVVYDDGVDLFSRPAARVYTQSPLYGLKCVPGTSVTLHLTVDEGKLRDSGTASDQAARQAAAQQQIEAEINRALKDE